TAAQNLRKSVERARYRPVELVLEPLAASYAVLTDDEKELGVALIEVGGGSTGVAIFHEGKIRHLASLKFAGAHVTSDLVAGLGVTQTDAERLQERHGVADPPLVDAAEMINLPSTPSQGARQASRELLSHIIHQRVDEIFQLAQRGFEGAGAGGGRPQAGGARGRAVGVRRWTTTGGSRADGRDGAPARDGGAGARRLRGAGAGRDP